MYLRNLITAVVIVGAHSASASNLDDIYYDPGYNWDYYVENGVNDIDSTQINDVRLFLTSEATTLKFLKARGIDTSSLIDDDKYTGNYYIMTIYSDQSDKNSQYDGIFVSKQEDGIDGIFAVARNSGFRWGVNQVLQNMQNAFGSEYMHITPIKDGGSSWEWTLNTWRFVGDKLDDYMKENAYGDRFNHINTSEQTSGYSSAYLVPGGIGVILNNSYGKVWGSFSVVDPNNKVHKFDYNHTTYEDGASYGYVSNYELMDMINGLAKDLVEPIFEAGWDQGYDAGYEAGYNDGFEDGFDFAIKTLKEN